MYYNNVCGEKLSGLGFGAMRLPCNEDSSINVEETEKMIDYAIEHGVNYFDTAYVYHGGKSESVIGKILSKYPREKYKIASKLPGHGLYDSFEPSYFLEKQLKKCCVDFFDFYLLHNVCEFSMNVYEDPKWDIINYLVDQKKKGRIKHLGFSTHAKLETLKDFIERHEGVFDFCQIQLNYLDWTLQDADKKVELLKAHNIPIWVMEPVRGGKLAAVEGLDKPVEKAFRYLQGIDGIGMILSGMSNMKQVVENIETFNERKPLSKAEVDNLYAIAETLKSSVPCTKCRYCTPSCPQGLNIPMFLSVYNELQFAHSANASMCIEALPKDKQPSACLKCGACKKMCPQGIDIPTVLEELDAYLKSHKTWVEVCEERRAVDQKERLAEK